MNRWADSKYFAAMGIPILRGRTFNPGLRLDQAREIIISDAFAKAYFHGEEPLGKHIRTIGSVFTIVGIVGDTRYSIGEQPGPVKYFSMEMGAWGGTLVIRSDHDVEQLALPIQRVIGTLDRDLPVSDVFTMDQLLGLSTLDQSLDAALLLVFAVLALVLASVGLFGVLSYVVSQKTNEIGVRIALGAQRRQVLGLVLFDGMKPALIGLVCGMAASVACARLFYHYAGSLLYETSVLDPATFIAVAITLLLVATLACALPAWRASRMNPTELLRAQ
jgi:putative ABC transport system permease protein